MIIGSRGLYRVRVTEIVPLDGVCNKVYIITMLAWDENKADYVNRVKWFAGRGHGFTVGDECEVKAIVLACDVCLGEPRIIVGSVVRTCVAV